MYRINLPFNYDTNQEVSEKRTLLDIEPNYYPHFIAKPAYQVVSGGCIYYTCI